MFHTLRDYFMLTTCILCSSHHVISFLIYVCRCKLFCLASEKLEQNRFLVLESICDWISYNQKWITGPTHCHVPLCVCVSFRNGKSHLFSSFFPTLSVENWCHSMVMALFSELESLLIVYSVILGAQRPHTWPPDSTCLIYQAHLPSLLLPPVISPT